VRSMWSNSIGRLDRADRGDQRCGHRMGYPRHRIWLLRRRDRPGDFSIKSTKVQSFDDAITGGKKPQSLNSGNRPIRGPKLAPRTAEQETLLRTTSDHRNIAGIRDRSIRLPGRYAVAGVGRHPDICQPRNRRTIILRPTADQRSICSAIVRASSTSIPSRVRSACPGVAILSAALASQSPPKCSCPGNP
jgi:hypothetical protein